MWRYGLYGSMGVAHCGTCAEVLIVVRHNHGVWCIFDVW